MTTLVLMGLLTAPPADRAVVPIELQAELLAKVLRYDRAFVGRGEAEVRVLVVYAAGSAESERVARELLTAVAAQPKLGGLAHREELVPFSGGPALAAKVKDSQSRVVLFAPGLAPHAPELRLAFDGVDCLTVTSTPAGVREGLVLGFDLVSDRPRMLFNLGQSRRQGADFQAEVLQLMTVYP